MNQLIAYLLENLVLDVQGDLTLDLVRDFLREDNSREAKALQGKLVEDGGVDDMLICVADCLREHLSTGISAGTVQEQLQLYTES